MSRRERTITYEAGRVGGQEYATPVYRCDWCGGVSMQAPWAMPHRPWCGAD